MRWPWRSPSDDQKRCLGIELHRGCAQAVLREADGVSAIFRSQASADGSALNALEQLNPWLEQHKLKGCRVSVCLGDDDYRLHLVEAPQVEDGELNDALSFRLADMIGESTEDKVIQAFRLPADAYRGRLDMAFAAVAERNVVADIVGWCRTQGLKLSEVTIAELALLRVLEDIEPQTSVAVLRLDEHQGSVNLYQYGSLYFSREMELGLAQLRPFLSVASTPDNELAAEEATNTSEGFVLQTEAADDEKGDQQALADLALELRRSLDYFESQLGMGSVGQILLLPPDNLSADGSQAQPLDIDRLLLELETQVNTPVRSLSLQSLYNRVSDQAILTASSVVAIGGSLSYDLAG